MYDLPKVCIVSRAIPRKSDGLEKLCKGLVDILFRARSAVIGKSSKGFQNLGSLPVAVMLSREASYGLSGSKDYFQTFRVSKFISIV